MSTHPFKHATRNEALARLDHFRPAMGSVYATKRNFDFGPDRRDNVSMVSPYIRHRLISEQEAVQTALKEHSASAAEKFIQEVVWRTYWKGWLEQRLTVWEDYLYEAADDHEKLAHSGGLRREYERAIKGETGIECFNFWVNELIETGYLHNHARMWFASIWIFTLRLPWALGAEFFYHHLLDGDAASNTLSWRWVGGLHTAGKTYLARPDNIAKFTGNRFQPSSGELAHNADPLYDADLPERKPLSEPPSIDWSKPTALLITADDCTPEQLDVPLENISSIATFATHQFRTQDGASETVLRFERDALADAANRANVSGSTKVSQLETTEQLSEWANDCGAQQIVTAYMPVGTARDAVAKAQPDFKIPFLQIRRQWDAAFWPHATAGFFKVKKKIPSVLQNLGLG